jgi:hypothetical protein
MGISGIGGLFGGAPAVAQAQNQQKLPTASFAALVAAAEPAGEGVAKTGSDASGTSARDQFLAYMKETPAQRLQDAWLAQHGVSREEFEAMSADQKQQLLDEMKREIEEKTKDKLEKAAFSPVNVLA